MEICGANPFQDEKTKDTYSKLKILILIKLTINVSCFLNYFKE
jgi:hypothetical protein